MIGKQAWGCFALCMESPCRAWQHPQLQVMPRASLWTTALAQAQAYMPMSLQVTSFTRCMSLLPLHLLINHIYLLLFPSKDCCLVAKPDKPSAPCDPTMPSALPSPPQTPQNSFNCLISHAMPSATRWHLNTTCPKLRSTVKL